MAVYKLREPEKNSQPIGYWFFVMLMTSFMIYIVILNPISNGSWRQWGFFSSSLEYVIINSLAFISAMLLMIPVVINDRKHDRVMALLWANRHNIMHDDFMNLMDKLEYHVFRKGNSREVQTDLQNLVDKYKGKDQRIKQYHMNPEFAENLEKVSDGKAQ